MKNSTYSFRSPQSGLGLVAGAGSENNNLPAGVGGNKTDDIVNVISKAVDVGRQITGFFGGGNKESQSDLNKQAIQNELARMGYPQFSKMSGWGGDEKAKESAVQLIYLAVQQYPDAGNTITNWLEGGKITPNTITRVKQNYNVSAGTGGSPSMMSGSTGINPLWVIGGTAAAGVLLLMVNFKKKE